MTAYETGQDLLAETCRERWAAQFDDLQRAITARSGSVTAAAAARWSRANGESYHLRPDTLEDE